MSLSKGKQLKAGALRGRAKAGGLWGDDGGLPVQTAGHHTRRDPGSELSRTGRPWSRGHSGTADGGGTCRRSDSAASRCRTPELQTQSRKGSGDREAWLIDHSVIGAGGNINRQVHGAQAASILSCLHHSAPLQHSRHVRKGETKDTKQFWNRKGRWITRAHKKVQNTVYLICENT